MNLIKPFTITGAALAAGIVIGKVYTNSDKKRKNEFAKEELARLHEIEKAEIKKNGQASNETRKAISNITNKALK